METALNIPYHFESASAPHTAAYLTQPILDACANLSALRVLDLGCGNGALCGALSDAGFDVVGCDPSKDGLTFARRSFPQIPFHPVGVYDDPLTARAFFADPEPGGGFDVVVSTEVIEHLFEPAALLRFAAKVLRPGGHLILTTPYHGYLKNLALAITGKLDAHFTALWDGGHIKFWSRATLSRLLVDNGFKVIQFIGAGRFHYFWKSMIVIAQMRTP